jgi:GH15 family glucan-1,4-alpha-glucosidase
VARDLTWPHVGTPNHLLGRKVRLGLWVEGRLSWLDDGTWRIDQAYEPDTLVGWTLAHSDLLGLSVELRDAVDPSEPVWVREIVVRNRYQSDRKVNVFVTHDFDLGQSDVGNTAFYEPFSGALVHYRGPHYAAVRIGQGEFDYVTGIKGFNGLEGTWRDAEDGALSANPIAQGSVDSTIGSAVDLDAEGTSTVWWTLRMGGDLSAATRRVEACQVLERSRESGALVMSSLGETPGLSPGARALVRQSLLLVQAFVDREGAVLAATDSDILETNRATYSYCWGRDAGLVTKTLADLGLADSAERFVQFCSRVVTPERPYLLQKYRADGHWGASWHPWLVDGRAEAPIQEDETALALVALGACGSDQLWASFGRAAAAFIVAHRSDDGLPLPSWDLWEERRGVHFFTTCAVVAGLRACSSWEPSLREVADQLVARLGRFWSDDRGRFLRSLGDETADSSVLAGLLLLGPEDVAVSRIESCLSRLDEALRVRGGLARYEQDYYFRTVATGNPWVISTLWWGQLWARLGDPAPAVAALEWAAERAETTLVLAEQYAADDLRPLSVSPLTWSHAEVLQTAVEIQRHAPA